MRGQRELADARARAASRAAARRSRSSRATAATARSAPARLDARASRAPCASKWFAASRKRARSRAEVARSRARRNPARRLSPVPTAVPPSASSASASRARVDALAPRSHLRARSRRTPGRAASASRPSGACGRSSRRRRTRAPSLRATPSSASSAGTSSLASASRAATCSAVGITSFDDWPTFTWSFGWTGLRAALAAERSRVARFAITSFAFMFVEVPEPVWNTSTGKCASSAPRDLSRRALRSPRALGVEHAARRVRRRRRRLDQPERLEEAAREALAADREVLDRALGRRAPERVGRHPHLAERVALRARRARAGSLVRHRRLPPLAAEGARVAPVETSRHVTCRPVRPTEGAAWPSSRERRPTRT